MPTPRRRGLSGGVAAVAVGYLLGTAPSARAASALAGRGRDVTTEGSGNPGALNAATVLGRRWGAAVLAADLAKGAGAGVVGRRLAGGAGAYLAGAAAVAGHVLPVWAPSAGGKGVATALGATAAVSPVALPAEVAAALLTAAVTRRSETAAGVAAAAWVTAAVVAWRAGLSNRWGPPTGGGLVGFAAAGASLVLYGFARGHRLRPEAGA